MKLNDKWRYTISHPAIRVSLSAFVLAVFVTGGMFVGFWWPDFREAAEIRSELGSLKITIRNTMRAEIFLEGYRKAEAALKKWDLRLDAANPENRNITFLTELAEKYSVNILSLVHQQNRHPSGLGVLNQEFVATGSYRNLKGFLAQIEGLQTMTILDFITFERSAHERQEIRANLRLMTFHSKMETTPL